MLCAPQYVQFGFTGLAVCFDVIALAKCARVRAQQARRRLEQRALARRDLLPAQVCDTLACTGAVHAPVLALLHAVSGDVQLCVALLRALTLCVHMCQARGW